MNNEKRITEDTRLALEALAPICRELRINIDVDGAALILNGQRIGIACNSTYATIMEAIGYIFFREYPRFRCSAWIDDELQENIQRYWGK